MNKAAFLDRDGVINRKAPEGQYITRWEDMEFLPGVAGGITLLKRSGFTVIVVSNQRCVAKGLLTAEGLNQLHERIQAALAAKGAIIDAGFYCPHDVDPPCTCRKPKPGLLFDAARMHGIVLDASWMIGDSDSDIDAGKAAGCKTARVVRQGEVPGCASDISAHDLFDAAQKIVQFSART
jgi:histidinol-phosphate phosphatase family protein